MFNTHESMEMGVMRLFNEHNQFWRMVERNDRTPWFHLTLRADVDGQPSTHTAMPTDVTLLADLLNQPDGPVQVIDVQAVTPDWMNGKGRWVMEPLAKLEMAKTSSHDVVHIYTTVEGETYHDLPNVEQKLKQLRDRKVLYARPTMVPAMTTSH